MSLKQLYVFTLKVQFQNHSDDTLMPLKLMNDIRVSFSLAHSPYRPAVPLIAKIYNVNVKI